MKSNKLRTITTVLTLSLLMVGWACQTWLTIATLDLPVLEQEAKNIIAIADPSDSQLATNISSGVSASLTFVSDAITAYKADPSDSNLQKVAAALEKASTDLPALLVGVQFRNVTVGLAIEAGVTAIVTTLDIIAAQLPSTTAQNAKMRLSAKNVTMSKSALKPEAIKANWNAKVCDANPSLAHCPRM